MLPLSPSDPLQIGGLSLVGRLGVGGMGVVYLARQATGEFVALKVIRPDLTADPQFRSRFATEVRHALSVTGPFLADAREASTSMTPQFIAWAYVPGENLGVTVRTGGPLEQDEVGALAAALADSLGRLHSAGIVHRDVKPSNVQIGPHGPVLLDLGVSRSLDTTSLTITTATIGTPAWMSPEQWRGDPHGPAGDMWAWGAVVAFGAGGDHPFGTGTGEALGYRIVHEAPSIPPLNEPLAGLVARALDKEPGVRPDWQEVLTALGIDSASVADFVTSRWTRLGLLALEHDENADPPTVLVDPDRLTVASLTQTRLDSPISAAPSWWTGRGRMIAVAAGSIALIGIAAAAVLGQLASPADGAPEPSAPTVLISLAPTPTPTEQPTLMSSPSPTAAPSPTPTPTKGKDKPAQDHGKPKGAKSQ